MVINSIYIRRLTNTRYPCSNITYLLWLCTSTEQIHVSPSITCERVCWHFRCIFFFENCAQPFLIHISNTLNEEVHEVDALDASFCSEVSVLSPRSDRLFRSIGGYLFISNLIITSVFCFSCSLFDSSVHFYGAIVKNAGFLRAKMSDVCHSTTLRDFAFTT